MSDLVERAPVLHTRYIEVCRGIQNRLSDVLERRGLLGTICRRAIELDNRERRVDAWKYAWDNYASMFPPEADANARKALGKGDGNG